MPLTLAPLSPFGPLSIAKRSLAVVVMCGRLGGTREREAKRRDVYHGDWGEMDMASKKMGGVFRCSIAWALDKKLAGWAKS